LIYAVLADIHSNLPALKTAISWLENKGIIQYVVLGDIVGYGPHPNECIETIQKLSPSVLIKGNHDWASSEDVSLDNFNPYAKEAILWTRLHLLPGNVNYLRNLPERAKLNGVLLIHGSPHDPLNEYLTDDIKFVRCTEMPDIPRVCFVGHSHYPLLFVRQKDGPASHSLLLEGDSIQLVPGNYYTLNPGSIGQPRDGDPRLSFALWDSDKSTFTIVRLKYDISRTQKDMLKAGLPEFLVHRLETGN
jgi:diadenosine tetraphosphatase ApaH/serine/threonine PP2A family protein phosphatase